jgi:hypothetical protein
MAMCYNDLRDIVKKRIWYDSDDAFAFLVDTPFTFGHSQLVMKIHKWAEEEDNFAKASIHATNCIKTLRTKLYNQWMKWPKLAEYTNTSGSYVKTLVLRVSADEAVNTYKIHLVPYFASHSNDTEELYRKNQKKKKGTGGLVNWLGERERKVDSDMCDGRNDPIVKKRIESFKLYDLTSFLRSGRTM